MAIGVEIKDDLEEEVVVLDEAAAMRPCRVALFVESSPFAYISGYKNRFQNFIKHLREMGDEVIVVTNHEGVPQEFHGAKVIGSWSFPCPLYGKVPLSLALSPRIIISVMYSIWTSRNNVTHGEANYNPMKTMEVIQETLQALEMPRVQKQPKPPRPKCTWHGPAADFVKVNSDGAVQVALGVAASGVVARDATSFKGVFLIH